MSISKSGIVSKQMKGFPWKILRHHLCIIRIKEGQGQNLEEPHTGLPPYQINDYQSQVSACGLINMIGTRNLSLPLYHNFQV